LRNYSVSSSAAPPARSPGHSETLRPNSLPPPRPRPHRRCRRPLGPQRHPTCSVADCSVDLLSN
jgi:hypothetical protein